MSETIHAVFGSVERRGAWVVPAELSVRVKCGNAELDLREAVMTAELTTIDVNIRLGNVEIIVPPGMVVDMRCLRT